MHQGGVRLCRAMLSIAAAGFLVWGFSVKAVSPSDLLITKIQITGGTGLTTHDFVSIYNKSSEPIDLQNLRLVKRTKTGTTDTTLKSWTVSTIINPGAYYTWAHSDIASTINANASSSQTISNDNGVALREGAENSGAIIDSVGWGSAANIFVEASPFSTNPIGGQYLERINNLDTNDNSVDFQIYPPVINEETTEETETEQNTAANQNTPTGKDLIINELYVNPKEIDGRSPQTEFIELYNKGTEAVALDAWRLEIGDIVFELPRGTTLAPGGFTSLYDSKNFPLPNSGATIKLFAPDRVTAAQSVTYKKAPDAFSYAYFSGTWRWTAIATPDKANVLAQAPQADFEILGELLPGVVLNFDSSDSFSSTKSTQYLWDFGNGQTSVEQYPQYSFAKAGKYKISLTVKNDYGSSTSAKTVTIVNNLEEKQEETKEETKAVLGEKTTVEKTTPRNDAIFTTAGTVVVAPAIFGVQYFYLLPEYGEPLIQVYNSKKLFPALKIGDQVIVTGEYSEPETGPRLKTKDVKDIQITGHKELDIVAAETSADLKSPPYPRLSRVIGKIVSKKSPHIFLADEQGEVEIYLSKNTGLKIADFTIGDTVSISGILILNNETARLQPRNKSDLSKIEQDEPIDFKAAALPVTETKKISEEITVPEKTPNKKMLLFYLIAASVVIIGAVIYSLYKKK